MRCDGGSFFRNGDWVFDFGVAMTTDPDAPATLRNVAEMMRDVLGASYVSAPIWPDTAHACKLLSEIATAPAVAKAALTPAPDITGTIHINPLRNQIDPKREKLEPPDDHFGRPQEPKPDYEPASPADPFAPMVEAALDVYYGRGMAYAHQSPESCMRRALAAAIENAPITDNMRDAGLRCVTRGDGPRHVFGAMTSILAAELRGDGK